VNQKAWYGLPHEPAACGFFTRGGSPITNDSKVLTFEGRPGEVLALDLRKTLCSPTLFYDRAFNKTTTMKTLRELIILCFGLLLASTTAHAGPGPEGFVKAKQGELTVLLKQNKSSATEQKIGAVFDQLLDYDTLAKDSLADHWNDRSEAERREFHTILKQLVQRNYRKNLRKTLEYAVEYRGESKAKKGYLVRTVAKNRKNPREEPISIDYVLHEVDGKWLVADIITEGSSLVNTYKSQFRRVIKKKGFDGLLKQMKAKLDQESA
jgi:phospholipid transport system substrate-binding protein